MGLYFRKSKSIGPFRINFSKSGVGVSTGVKGARISKGPRGTTVYAGRDGVYYRKTISKKKKTASKGYNKGGSTKVNSTYKNTSSVSNNLLSTLNGSEVGQSRNRAIADYYQTPYVGENSYAFYPGTDSITTNVIEDNFIASVNSLKVVRLALLLLAIASVALACFTKLIPAVAGGMAVVFLVLRAMLKIDLEYSLTEEEELEWNNVLVELCKLKESQKTGLIIADDNLYSEREMQRFSQLGILSAGTANNSRIRCNVDAFQLICESASIYLLPSCIYLVTGKDLKLYSYAYIDIEKANIRVYEHGYDYASDALNVSRSWLHETKDGSPDMRYKDNPMTAIVTYGLLSLSSSSNMETAVAISKKGVADSICNALINYRDHCLMQSTESPNNESVHETYDCNIDSADNGITTDVIIGEEEETVKQFSNNPLIQDLKQNLYFEDGDNLNE